jgi:glyoxylase-like metal-dependent hydrolase (beta-lactamase superfamily II)
MKFMKVCEITVARLLCVAVLGLVAGRTSAEGQSATPQYSIQAIRFGTLPDIPVAELVMGGPKDVKIDIADVIWLIRGGGHTILFDSGFHRDTFAKRFPTNDYLRPDEAVKLAGVQPEQVTDIVISHAHWDHMGGIDLFPKAQVWFQAEEYRYYTLAAWQPGGKPWWNRSS